MPSAVLAEPEPETREYLGRQLRDDGFDVLGAARRSEALELVESARPDVVLIAEVELCLRLRRGEPGRSWDRNVPVIVLAPSSDPVERVRALDRGADDVIGRPFAYEELLARIRALLAGASAGQSDIDLRGRSRASTVRRGGSTFARPPSSSPRRSSSSSRSSPPTPTACSRRRSCSVRCGAIARSVARGRLSRMPRVYARSSVSRPRIASSSMSGASDTACSS